MNSIYYTKIGQHGSGLTNQIFTFITSIIISKYMNKCVIICDHFYNDFSDHKTTPASEILDIEKMNIFLKKYNIVLFDKNNVNFNIKNIKYGINGTMVDITDKIVDKFYNEEFQVLHIPKMFDLNSIKGDPVPGVKKEIIIQYTINNMQFSEINNEWFANDIEFDLKNAKYSFLFRWINTFDRIMFDDILKNIVFNNIFLELAINNKNIPNLNGKVNILHLRLEYEGGLDHWSKQNNMEYNVLKSIIENKYISIIEKYINKSDTNIVLSASENNIVIDYLKNNGYKTIIPYKYFTNARELNAIVDFSISKSCNNVFVGNFNMQHLNGSTFSYFISNQLENNVKQVLIDLDRIHNDEMIFYNKK